jgi:ABC-type phosphate transport system ATPase subunit
VLFLDSGKLVEQGPADRFFTAPQTTAAKDYLAGRLPGISNGDTNE